MQQGVVEMAVYGLGEECLVTSRPWRKAIAAAAEKGRQVQ